MALSEFRTPVDLFTRGPLIVRDVDVLADLSRRAGARVSVSITTLDPAMAARLEPGVAPPRQRLRVIRTLTDAGVACGVAVAPVLPGLTDAPRDLAAVLAAARDSGATHTWSNLLNLRPGTREHFLATVAREWPDELPRYERLYPAGGSGYLPRREAVRLEGRIGAIQRGADIRDRRRVVLLPAREPEQLPLALDAPDAGEVRTAGAAGARAS